MGYLRSIKWRHGLNESLDEIGVELKQLEIKDFIRNYVDNVIENDGGVSDEYFYAWESFTEFEQGLAFHFTVGYAAGLKEELAQFQ